MHGAFLLMLLPLWLLLMLVMILGARLDIRVDTIMFVLDSNVN